MNLASIPSPPSGVWNLGPLPLRGYALCIVIGIVLACVITERRLRARGAPDWTVLDIAVWAVLCGIVGARIYHVITDPELYFAPGRNWLGIFQIWNGGLGIWGAVAGGAVGAWIACRRRGIPLSTVADALAPGLPVAQAVGRWGNYFNQELYGRPSTLPWAVRIDPDIVRLDTPDYIGYTTFHPTFLYECVWDLAIAVAVWLIDRRYRFGRGRAFALYVMLYVVGRAGIEALRIDQANTFLGLRVNDWVSIVVFVLALLYFVLVRGPRVRLVVGDDGRMVTVPDDGRPSSEPTETVTTDGEPTGSDDADPGSDGEPGSDDGDPGSDPAPDAEPDPPAGDPPRAEDPAPAGDRGADKSG